MTDTTQLDKIDSPGLMLTATPSKSFSAFFCRSTCAAGLASGGSETR